MDKKVIGLRKCLTKLSQSVTVIIMRTGLSHTRAYVSWHNMIYRCTNPKDKKWKYYGGRGIRVCSRWKQFDLFYKDMGDRPEGTTLDRIEGDKGYYKENCRWADRKTQQENRRLRKSEPVYLYKDSSGNLVLTEKGKKLFSEN